MTQKHDILMANSDSMQSQATPPSPTEPVAPTTVAGGVVGKVVARTERNLKVQSYVPEIAKGMGVLMKHFFHNTKELVLGQRNDRRPDRKSVV